VYRVDERCQFATAAHQMRHNSLKYAKNSPCKVADMVVITDDDDGYMPAPKKPFMNTGVLGDNGENECEYSASGKIDSSFVPDSLALDVPKSEGSDINVLNQSGSEKMQINNGSAHMNCQLQISEHQYRLQQMSQQLASDDADVPQHEQTPELSTVAAVASTYLKHAGNTVSICVYGNLFR